MKKLFIILSILLVFVFSADALQQKRVIARRNAVSCTTANDSQQWATNQDEDAGATAAWRATKISLVSQITLTAFRGKVCDDGADAGTIEFVLMDHDAANDYPDETSEVSGSSIITNMSVITTNCATYTMDEFALASPLVVSAGTYWIVNKEAGGSARRILIDQVSVGDRACYSNDSGTTWACSVDEADLVEAWGCN